MLQNHLHNLLPQAVVWGDDPSAVSRLKAVDSGVDSGVESEVSYYMTNQRNECTKCTADNVTVTFYDEWKPVALCFYSSSSTTTGAGSVLEAMIALQAQCRNNVSVDRIMSVAGMIRRGFWGCLLYFLVIDSKFGQNSRTFWRHGNLNTWIIPTCTTLRKRGNEDDGTDARNDATSLIQNGRQGPSEKNYILLWRMLLTKERVSFTQKYFLCFSNFVHTFPYSSVFTSLSAYQITSQMKEGAFLENEGEKIHCHDCKSQFHVGLTSSLVVVVVYCPSLSMVVHY